MEGLPFYWMDSAAIAEKMNLLLPVAEEAHDRRAVFALKFHRFGERGKLNRH